MASKQATLPSSPQELFLGEDVFPRSLLQIPRDQQKLLGRPDSWATELETTSRGMVNLPPDILDALREFYNPRVVTEAPQLLPQPSNPDAIAVPTIETDDLDSSSETAESVERDISWPPSSPICGNEAAMKHRRGTSFPLPRSQTGQQESEPGSSRPRTPHGSRNGATSASSNSINHTTLAKPSQFGPRKRQLQDVFPPSLDHEEEMAVEIPMALDGQANSAAKVAKVANSPSTTPCRAQQVPTGAVGSRESDIIPCSYVNLRSPQSYHITKRQRTQPMQLEGGEHSTCRQASPEASIARPQVPPLIQRNPAPSIPSSSVIPATWQIPDSRSSPFKSNAKQPQSSLQSPIAAPSNREAVPMGTMDLDESSQVSASSPNGKADANISSITCPTPMINQEKGADPQSTTHSSSSTACSPFEEFKRTYPTYQCSLDDFLTSCLCIARLQERRFLRGYLYDDYIRALSQEYSAYVESTTTPLSALSWYNDSDNAPLYSQCVITRSKLQQVLAVYPEDLARLRTASNQGENTLSFSAIMNIGLVDNSSHGDQQTLICPQIDIIPEGATEDTLSKQITRAHIDSEAAATGMVEMQHLRDSGINSVSQGANIGTPMSTEIVCELHDICRSANAKSPLPMLQPAAPVKEPSHPYEAAKLIPQSLSPDRNRAREQVRPISSKGLSNSPASIKSQMENKRASTLESPPNTRDVVASEMSVSKYSLSATNPPSNNSQFQSPTPSIASAGSQSLSRIPSTAMSNLTDAKRSRIEKRLKRHFLKKIPPGSAPPRSNRKENQ
jgi:hypothetical protein